MGSRRLLLQRQRAAVQVRRLETSAECHTVTHANAGRLGKRSGSASLCCCTR